MKPIKDAKELRAVFDRALKDVSITDMHTHLYAPCFGDLLLWGIDEQLTFHYLVAEAFRWLDIPYERFWELSKQEQADLVWKALFVDNTPVSEAARGVVTSLRMLGLDDKVRDLGALRKYFAGIRLEQHLDKVFEMTGVRDVVMTNDPFDDLERPVWEKSYRADERFKAALRIDPVLMSWDQTGRTLKQWGYDVRPDLSGRTLDETRRFLSEWCDRMNPLYMAVSLPPTFAYPDKGLGEVLLERAILPVCRDRNIPFAAMIGVKRGVNPDLRLAGDAVGRADIDAVERLCFRNPKNKFLVTALSRENQHQLCVAARKFRNMMVFGCWWYVNTPNSIRDITRMRLELLGTSFIPQHSDCRVFDQLVYKWEHCRKVIGDVLFEKYRDLMESGWAPSEQEIRRDLGKLFGENFSDFLKKEL